MERVSVSGQNSSPELLQGLEKEGSLLFSCTSSCKFREDLVFLSPLSLVKRESSVISLNSEERRNLISSKLSLWIQSFNDLGPFLIETMSKVVDLGKSWLSLLVVAAEVLLLWSLPAFPV